jgi:hypothetical protein
VRRRIPYFLLTVLVVLAGAFTVISYNQSTASGSSVKLLRPCQPVDLTVKPSTYIVSCADANTEFTDLRWTGWGDETAYATGEARWNDCTPTCVAGHWRSEPATFWVWDPRQEPHLNLAKFHNLTIYTKLASDSQILGMETIESVSWGELKSSTVRP